MHGSVHQFIKDHTNGDMFANKRVLEVGSLDINGSVRPYIEETYSPSEYLATDMMDGEGVDEVVDANNLIKRYGRNSFDTVVTTEMLEHAEDWRRCIDNIKQITKQWLVVTTRSPGFPLHAYPDDHWRYTLDDFKAIFADFDIITLEDDPEVGQPGVFMIAKKTKRKTVDLKPIELTPAPKPVEQNN